jgi:hypothetical protein
MSQLSYKRQSKFVNFLVTVFQMFCKVLVFIIGLVAITALPWDPVETPGYPLFTLKSNEVEQFVVGGSVASSGQFPYQAALRTPAGLFFCGAVIISNVSDYSLGL